MEESVLLRSELEKTGALEINGKIQAVSVRQKGTDHTVASQRSFADSIANLVSDDMKNGFYEELIIEPDVGMQFSTADLLDLATEEQQAAEAATKRAPNVLLLTDEHRIGDVGESSIIHSHHLDPENYDFNMTLRLDEGVCPSVYYPNYVEVAQLIWDNRKHAHEKVIQLVEQLIGNHADDFSRISEQEVATLGHFFFRLGNVYPETQPTTDNLMNAVERQYSRVIQSSTKQGSITFFRGIHGASSEFRGQKPGSLWTQHYDDSV